MDLGELLVLAHEAPRDALPEILGKLAEAEARVRLRLAEVPAPLPPGSKPPLDVGEAATMAGTSKRWLLHQTKGMRFRCDLSRKQPRFDEAGLRAWLAGRRR